MIEGNRGHETRRRNSETGVSELTDQSNEICFLTERARQRFIERGQRKLCLRANAGETELGHWTRCEVGDLPKPGSRDLVMFHGSPTGVP